MIPIRSKVQSVKPSKTMEITQRAMDLVAEDKHVIRLSVGEPDINTPEHIRQAAHHAIEEGQTKYTNVAGTPELRAAIAAKLKRDNKLEYQSNEIIVNAGAKHSLFNALTCVLEAGDEVLIPVPYWVSYPDMVEFCDGVPVYVTPRKGLKIDAEDLERMITPRTRVLIMNSPNNPSGAFYSREELQELAEVLLRHPKIVILTDDIYELLNFSEQPFYNLAMLSEELRQRCIVINGVSKAYAMTGWRIGYIAAASNLVKAVYNLQSQSTSSICSISQVAACAALNGDHSPTHEMVRAFKHRHDLVYQRLSQMPGVHCEASGGAFYLFPDFSEWLKQSGRFDDDVAMAASLLDDKLVATVPGSAFGASGHLRLSIATSEKELMIAMDRLEAFLR